jgi:transposase
MSRYIGLDVHKESIHACFLDADGGRLHRCQLAATREAVTAFAASRLEASDHVVLEATTNTWEIVELIAPRVAEVAVANPLKVKAIAESRVKTDKIDAEVLAQLLRCDYLPRVWSPDLNIKRLRELSAHRAALVSDQTRIKNRIQSLLAQRLVRVPVPVLFNKPGRRWLLEQPLVPQDRQ